MRLLLIIVPPLLACGGKTLQDGGADASEDVAYSCSDQPSPLERRCLTTTNAGVAADLCGQVDATVDVGYCPTGYEACCFSSQVTTCYYAPTYLDAVASLCGEIDGSFVHY